MVLGDKQGKLYSVDADAANLLTDQQITDLLNEAKEEVAMLEGAAAAQSQDPAAASDPNAQPAPQI